jgi:mRNA interferase YafQ
MRTIEYSTQFKRDYKHVKKNPQHRDLDSLILPVIEKLQADVVLPERNSDHPLSGSLKGYRDCHLKPDLLIIYSKPNPGILRLARLGSHSELFE